MSVSSMLSDFAYAADHPRAQLDIHLAAGKKVIGCFPYYAPEELVIAAGMTPFGIWGAHGTIRDAKQYFPAFYCTVAQMGLELSLRGELDRLSGVIMSSMCDTLRPLTQNFRVANPDMPFLFLAHPQNRRVACGVAYTETEYESLRARLAEISGREMTDDDLWRGIDIMNKSHLARREFVRLAAEHPDVVSAKMRSRVFKSAYFMDKIEHTQKLTALNAALMALPPCKEAKTRIVVSGILDDFDGILEAIDQSGLCIVADDVAQQSRAIRVDVDTTGSDPMLALAEQFAKQGFDTLLYDPEIDSRSAHVAAIAQESGAKGVLVLMMQFCDPEEMEYPSLKRALDSAGIACVSIGVDQQMVDFGQARTAIQAFADILNTK